MYQETAELVVETGRLDFDNPIENGIMIALRVREAWSLDCASDAGLQRLIELREEVNYLTSSFNSPRLTTQPLRLAAYTFDPSNVVHRVEHPDRPYDHADAVDLELRDEITALIHARPDIMKHMVSMDMLFTDS